MATRRRSSNRRHFVWARTGGVINVTTEGVGGIDLLQSVRDRYGGKEFVGATVMTVRGYARPNFPDGSAFVKGRMGIRVCNEGDLDPDFASQVRQGPGAPDFPYETESQPEYDWMAYLPFMSGDTEPTGTPATWNHAANPWVLDVRSNRRMEELGQTIGMWVQFDTVEGDTNPAVDYDLSVGLKLG